MKHQPKKESSKTITKICYCGKEFTRYISNAKQSGAKTCSNRCANTGKRSHMWIKNIKVEKANDKAYKTIHQWVRRKKKKPKRCQFCKKEKRLCWANIDHKYRRNLDDYIALCYSCHAKYDVKNNGKKIRNYSLVTPNISDQM